MIYVFHRFDKTLSNGRKRFYVMASKRVYRAIRHKRVGNLSFKLTAERAWWVTHWCCSSASRWECPARDTWPSRLRPSLSSPAACSCTPPKRRPRVISSDGSFWGTVLCRSAAYRERRALTSAPEVWQHRVGPRTCRVGPWRRSRLNSEYWALPSTPTDRHAAVGSVFVVRTSRGSRVRLSHFLIKAPLRVLKIYIRFPPSWFQRCHS